MGERVFLNTSERLASAVRAARLGRGLSEEELAEKAGVELSFLRDVEAGKPRPELAYVIDILDALELEAIALPSVPSAQKRGQLNLKKLAGRE